MTKSPTLTVALIPVIFLLVALAINVIGVFGDDALAGSNQFILLLAAAVAAIVGVNQGFKFKDIIAGIENSVGSTTGAILILLLIGALSGAWMISGVVPAMIYYGLKLLSPEIFLPATAIICALVSVATGSSWGTTACSGYGWYRFVHPHQVYDAYYSSIIHHCTYSICSNRVKPGCHRRSI